MTTVLPPAPDPALPPPVVPLPELARARSDDERSSRGDLLYRAYLVVLFGGLYGAALVHALATIAVPPLDGGEQLLVGVGVALIPVLASWAGISFGRIAGPVPIARPEASILLPTLIDRSAWLLPRLRRSYLVVAAGGAGIGLIGTVLLALNRSVGPRAWFLLPALVAMSSLLGAGLSAVTETLPAHSGRAWLTRLGPPAVATTLVVLVLVGPLGAVARTFAAGVTGTGPRGVAGMPLTVLGAMTVLIAMTGRRSVAGAHDEELVARAGLHGGLAASARLGDLRAIASVRDPLLRRRRHRSVPYPRRATGAVAWRNLTSLRSRPGPLGACAVGWAVATWLVAIPSASPTLSQLVLRTALAVAALYVGTTALLEPLRREHDSPLAAELLPFGFAHLNWLHLRSAFVLTSLVGVGVVPTVAALTAGTSLLAGASLPGVLVLVVFAGGAAVVVGGDRVRQPSTLGDIMTTLPGGVTSEMVAGMLIGRLLWPLMAMWPVGLLVGLAILSPQLGTSTGVVAGVSAALGVVGVSMRAAGLAIWLREYERRLQDADVLEPTSVLAMTWHRVRARVMRRGRPGAS